MIDEDVLRGGRYRRLLPRNRLSRWKTEDLSRLCSNNVRTGRREYIAAVYLDIIVRFRANLRPRPDSIRWSPLACAQRAPVLGGGGKCQSVEVHTLVPVHTYHRTRDRHSSTKLVTSPNVRTFRVVAFIQGLATVLLNWLDRGVFTQSLGSGG